MGNEPLACEILRNPSIYEPLAVRVLMRRREPLPAVLLGLCRLERLSASALGALNQFVGFAEVKRRLQVGEALLTCTQNPDMDEGFKGVERQTLKGLIDVF